MTLPHQLKQTEREKWGGGGGGQREREREGGGGGGAERQWWGHLKGGREEKGSMR